MRMHWERQEQYMALNKLRTRPTIREMASVLSALLHSVCCQTAWLWPRLIIVHVHVVIHSKCEYAAAVWWPSLADGISPHRLMHYIPIFFEIYCPHRCWWSLSGAIQYRHTLKFMGLKLLVYLWLLNKTMKTASVLNIIHSLSLQNISVHNVEFLCFQEPLLRS